VSGFKWQVTGATYVPGARFRYQMPGSKFMVSYGRRQVPGNRCCVAQSEVPGARRHVLGARLFMPGVRFNMLSAMCHVLGPGWQAKVPGGGSRVPGGAARYFLPCPRCHELCVRASCARWQMPPAICLVPVVSFHVLGARSSVPCATCQMPEARCQVAGGTPSAPLPTALY
jgi:hypothetical protein